MRQSRVWAPLRPRPSYRRSDALGGSEHAMSLATKIPCLSGRVPPRSPGAPPRASWAGGGAALWTNGFEGWAGPGCSRQAESAASATSAAQSILEVIRRPCRRAAAPARVGRLHAIKGQKMDGFPRAGLSVPASATGYRRSRRRYRPCSWPWPASSNGRPGLSHPTPSRDAC